MFNMLNVLKTIGYIIAVVGGLGLLVYLELYMS